MMNDGYVTQLNFTLKRMFAILILIFVFVGNSSAQYVSKELAATRLKERSAIVSSNISSLPTTSLEYRVGSIQVSTFKAIYDQLMEPSITVSEAVEKVFAKLLNSNLDRNAVNTATMAEFKKKNQLGGFDIYQPIKDEVKKVLK